MAYDTINRDKIDAFIPEKVANRALNKLTTYMNLARTVYRDFEPEVAQDGDTVSLPKYGSLTANEFSKTGTVTQQDPEDDSVSCTLDQHWESTFLIRDVAKAMANQNVIDGYVENGAIALAEKVETTLASLYTSAGGTVSAGSDLQLDDLRTLRKAHVDAKVPRVMSKFLYVDSDGYNDLLALANISQSDQFGSRNALLTGSIPAIYNYGIFESQNVQTSGSPSTYHCLGYTEQAMALAMRPLPNPGNGLGVRSAVVQDEESGIGMRVSYSWDPQHLGIQVTLDVLFGVTTVRDDFLIDVQHT